MRSAILAFGPAFMLSFSQSTGQNTTITLTGNQGWNKLSRGNVIKTNLFVTDGGVLVIKIEDNTVNTFHVQKAPQTGRLRKHSAKTYNITGSKGSTWSEMDNKLAQFSPGWKQVANTAFYYSSAHTTNLNGASCIFSFNGTAIGMSAELGLDRGYAKVTIDGVNQGCYNLYSSIARQQKVLFEKYNLADDRTPSNGKLLEGRST